MEDTMVTEKDQKLINAYLYFHLGIIAQIRSWIELMMVVETIMDAEFMDFKLTFEPHNPGLYRAQFRDSFSVTQGTGDTIFKATLNAVIDQLRYMAFEGEKYKFLQEHVDDIKHV